MTGVEAEAQIARILAQLERDTGSIVRDVVIRTIEITTISDTERKYLRHVYVNLEPIPGSQWG